MVSRRTTQMEHRHGQCKAPAARRKQGCTAAVNCTVSAVQRTRRRNSASEGNAASRTLKERVATRCPWASLLVLSCLIAS